MNNKNNGTYDIKKQAPYIVHRAIDCYKISRNKH